MSLHDTIDRQRGRLEGLLQRVPGFRGYFSRENRREADKLLRDFGSERLDRLISELHDAIKSATLEQMGGYQELINLAEKLRNELRHADRGYAGFFSEIKWDDESMLDALYEQDRAVVDGLAGLEALVSGADPDVGALRAKLKQLSRAFEARKSAILGLASE